MNDRSVAQRRRIAIALAITVVAVPIGWLFSGSSDESAEVAPTNVAPLAGDESTTSVAPTEDPLGTPQAAQFDRHVTIAPIVGGVIAVPDVSASLEGYASFDYDIEANDLCYARNATPGMFVTVTNLDNNRSTTCINTLVFDSPFADVIMHPDRFAAIADPTDAPVIVEYHW